MIFAKTHRCADRADFCHDEKHVPIPAITPVETTVDIISAVGRGETRVAAQKLPSKTPASAEFYLRAKATQEGEIRPLALGEFERLKRIVKGKFNAT